MPLIESGGFDAIGWGDDQLALACASHGGEPEHVAIVEAMLADIGLEEGDLACGPHDPLSSRGTKIAPRIRRAAHATPQQLLRQARRDARARAARRVAHVRVRAARASRPAACSQSGRALDRRAERRRSAGGRWMRRRRCSRLPLESMARA